MRALLAGFMLNLLIGITAAADAGAQSLPPLQLASFRDGDGVLRNADLQGKVVYLDFWASWCAPCRQSFPWLDAMQKKYRERGFLVVGINKDQERADAERFLARYPASFRLALDPGDALAKALDVKAMPTAYLIDRQGAVRKIHKGFRAADVETLEAKIQNLLERP